MASTAALSGGKPVFGRNHAWPRWPQIGPADRRRVLAVLDEGNLGIGATAITEFAERFAAYTGTRYALPVSSGTAALELIVKSLGIGPGDEVIVPAYTFVASATCVLEMGATVVFADLDPRTWCIDPGDVARRITARTRAIVVVHFAGNPADMAALKRLVRGRKIALIEDAAHAHGMLYRGKAPGHHGAAAAFSFQSSKNMTSGEGGIVVTNKKKLHDLAWSFHSFGRRHDRPWYAHHAMSWNHRITAMQCAILLGELQRLEQQTRRRHRHGAFLNHALAQIPGITPQADGDNHADTRRAYHLYLFRYDARVTGLDRQTFLSALAAEGVPASPGYPYPMQQAPLFAHKRYWHRQFLGRRALRTDPDYRRVRTPIVSELCRQAVWLAHPMLLAPRKDQQGIVDAVARVIEHAGELRKLAR